MCGLVSEEPLQSGTVVAAITRNHAIREEMTRKSTAKPKKGLLPDMQPGKEMPCVWMKAGVINFKLCDSAGNCLECDFDKAMHEAWTRRSEQRETQD